MTDFMQFDSFVENQLLALPIPAEHKSTIRRAIVCEAAKTGSLTAISTAPTATTQSLAELRWLCKHVYELAHEVDANSSEDAYKLDLLEERVHSAEDRLHALEAERKLLEKPAKHVAAELKRKRVAKMLEDDSGPFMSGKDASDRAEAYIRNIREEIAATSGEAKHPGPPSSKPIPQSMSKGKTGGKPPKGTQAKPAPLFMTRAGHSTPSGKNVERSIRQPSKAMGMAAHAPPQGTREGDTGVRGAKQEAKAWDVVHPGIEMQGKPAERKLVRKAATWGVADDGTTVIRGSELVSIVGTAGVTKLPGESMLTSQPFGVRLNPKMFGVILPIEASRYGCFRFRKVKATVCPVVTEFNAPAGNYLLTFQRDPNGTAPSPDMDGVEAQSSWEGNAVKARYNDYCELDCKLSSDTLGPSYVDSNSDIRFSEEGVIRVTAMTTVSSAQPSLGELFIEYEIVFFQNDVPTGAEPTVYLSNAGATQGVTGSALLTSGPGMTAAGSTDVALSLGNVTSTGPQFLLTVSNPGVSTTNWELNCEWYAITAGATVSFDALATFVASTQGQAVGVWNTAFTPFNSAPGSGPNVPSVSCRGTANPFNVFQTAGVSQPSASNVVGMQTWRISSNAPVFVTLSAPGLSAGTVNYRVVITRSTPTLQARTRAQAAFISTLQQRNVDAACCGSLAALPGLIGAINSYVDSIDAVPRTVPAPTSADLDYLAAFNVAIGTKLPSCHTPTAAPQFLPLLAGAAAWLIAKFGPTIAAHVVGYGARKLTEYAEGKNEEPTKRERERLRRDRRQREDGNPDI